MSADEEVPIPRDAFGFDLADTVHFEESPTGSKCAVDGCNILTCTFAFMQWGGHLGFVCYDHRQDRSTLHKLINRKFASFERH